MISSNLLDHESIDTESNRKIPEGIDKCIRKFRKSPSKDKRLKIRKIFPEI